MTSYLTIRPDSRYTRSSPVEPLLKYLQELPELVQTGPQEFRNAPGSPWVCLYFARAAASGGYHTGDALPKNVNVVELVCSDFEVERWYESLAQRIAAFLRWEVVADHGERTIYPAG